VYNNETVKLTKRVIKSPQKINCFFSSRRKSLSGNWKTNIGQSILVPMLSNFFVRKLRIFIIS
jgi:hypothetical protein